MADRIGRVVNHVSFQLPLLIIASACWYASGRVGGAYDFRIFRAAGKAVLHGRSPYVAPTVHLLAQNDRFVYPMPYAYIFVPFSLVNRAVGGVSFALLSTAAVLLSLRLLGVRDRRCFGIALLGVPVFDSLYLGTIGPLLLLLVAAAWRWRDSTWSGPLIAAAAAAKLFLWPLLIWLIVTRRLRATAAAGVTLAFIVAVWAVADLKGLENYPKTVRVLNDVERWMSYSVQTLWSSLKLPGVSVLLLLVSVAAVGVVAASARDDRRSFALAVTASLVATPILWLHYLVLLLVPIALFRPRLSWLWAVPVALWVTPKSESAGSLWKIAVVLVAIVLVQLAVLARRRTPRLESAAVGASVRRSALRVSR